MADLRVVYRISDKGRDKEKLANATKQHCLENAIATFGKDNLYVIADNCSPELISIIEKCGVEHEETSLGNIGSFKYALDKVVRDYPKDSYVYLLEDDYLHLPDSKEALLKGWLSRIMLLCTIMRINTGCFLRVVHRLIISVCTDGGFFAPKLHIGEKPRQQQ